MRVSRVESVRSPSALGPIHPDPAEAARGDGPFAEIFSFAVVQASGTSLGEGNPAARSAPVN